MQEKKQLKNIFKFVNSEISFAPEYVTKHVRCYSVKLEPKCIELHCLAFSSKEKIRVKPGLKAWLSCLK